MTARPRIAGCIVALQFRAGWPFRRKCQWSFGLRQRLRLTGRSCPRSTQGDVERSPRLSSVHRHWNKHENCRQYRFAGL